MTSRTKTLLLIFFFLLLAVGLLFAAWYLSNESQAPEESDAFVDDQCRGVDISNDFAYDLRNQSINGRDMQVNKWCNDTNKINIGDAQDALIEMSLRFTSEEDGGADLSQVGIVVFGPAPNPQDYDALACPGTERPVPEELYIFNSPETFDVRPLRIPDEGESAGVSRSAEVTFTECGYYQMDLCNVACTDFTNCTDGGRIFEIVGCDECGNGIVEEGEECDPPGSLVGNQICSDTCQLEDQPPLCGDGKVDPGEECDPPGSIVDGVMCDAFCQLDEVEVNDPFCGDGTVDPGEECDPPGSQVGDQICNASCELEEPNPFCGDGKVDPGEDCDPPGTTVDGKTCSNNCTLPPDLPKTSIGSSNIFYFVFALFLFSCGYLFYLLNIGDKLFRFVLTNSTSIVLKDDYEKKMVKYTQES